MNLNRKILFILPLATLLTLLGCGPSGNTFRLKGSISGMESGEIYIYNNSVEEQYYDTLRVENGKFFYSKAVDEVTPFIIVYPNAIEQVVFIGPGDEIEYKVASNSLNNYEIKGSDENKLMNSFREEILNAGATAVQAKAKKYISENTQSPVALYLFDNYFVQNTQTTYKEMMEILEVLRADNEDNTYFLRLEKEAKSMKTIGVGDSFPNIKLKGKNTTSQVWDSNSTLTVFLCWTVWMPTSYEFIAKIRQTESRYPKRDVRLVAYSVDNEYDRWYSMTRYDSIRSIEHFNDTKAFDSPVLKQLGVSKIPTYFIMNSDHRVISKGDNAQTLEAEIKKFLHR